MANIDGQEIKNEELAQALINDEELNHKINKMLEAEAYYQVKNTNILLKRREYSIGNNRKEENKDVSNFRLPNAFYRKAVKQKVDYAFGKPPVLSIEPLNPDTNNDAEEELYQKAWDNLLTPENLKAIKTLAQYAINCGIGYVYQLIDDKGFHLINVPSYAIRPNWTDITHTELNALLRDYPQKVYENGELKTVTKVELWTNEDVSSFISQTKPKEGLTIKYIDTEKHLQTDDLDKQSWNKIPFLWLKGTSDEMPLLNTCKALLDCYDNLNSQSVDTLSDDLTGIVVFKNYDPSLKSLVDAYIKLITNKVTAVDSDGGVSILKNDPNITSIQTKLEHLKKDINEFTSTVNIQDIQFGTNPSGVALKAAFLDVDIYTNDLEVEFELFISNLKYFFDKYLDWTNQVPLSISSKYKVIAKLDRDIMINETELIDNASKLQGMVSQETVDNYNPAVDSHTIEQERREKEKEAQIEQDNPFNFPNNPDEIESQENETNNLPE